ncbi:MAG TPA: fibronectin type III domain-containing protein [Bacteroidia bacterium]|nr:fibronectin type III domain-containing protein [Bacteroidia bacterium]
MNLREITSVNAAGDLCVRKPAPIPSFLIAAFLLFSSSLKAQSHLFVKTFFAGDSVMIRWVPGDAETWQLGNKNGYIIERFAANDYADTATRGFTVTPSPVFPLAQNDSAWTTLIAHEPAAAIVFSNLFESKTPSPDPQKRKTEESLSFGFTMKACDISVATAKAAGLFFIDKNVPPGRYVYRARIAGNKKTISGKAVANKTLSVLLPPDSLRGEFHGKKASLAFMITSTHEQYAGYIIERSADSIHFSRVNTILLSVVRSQYEQDKNTLMYRDTLPEFNRTYWYRVRGRSFFGFDGPPSAMIRGKGKEDMTVFPVMDTLYSPDNKTARLCWHLDSMETREDISGFAVLRAPSVDGPYAPASPQIISPHMFTFTDSFPSASSYYVIAVISMENDTGFSFPYLLQLRDETPPPVPMHLSGSIDTNGIARLEWENVAAPDLKGYRVFRCNTLNEEFSEVSDSILAQNFFTDTVTMQTLTRTIYYSVRSVDTHYNNSANSDPLLLKRPDKIPPVAPVAKFFFHTDSTIRIGWINSSSDDVMCVELERVCGSSGIPLGSWTGRDTVCCFTDAGVIPGETYSYMITVTDSSGNESRLVFPPVLFQPHIYPALKNFTAVADLASRTITLNWRADDFPVDRYIIYKAKNNDALRTWKTVDGKTLHLADRELYPGNTYNYCIKAVLKNGSETKTISVSLLF